MQRGPRFEDPALVGASLKRLEREVREGRAYYEYKEKTYLTDPGDIFTFYGTLHEKDIEALQEMTKEQFRNVSAFLRTRTADVRDLVYVDVQSGQVSVLTPKDGPQFRELEVGEFVVLGATANIGEISTTVREHVQDMNANGGLTYQLLTDLSDSVVNAFIATQQTDARHFGGLVHAGAISYFVNIGLINELRRDYTGCKVESEADVGHIANGIPLSESDRARATATPSLTPKFILLRI